MSKFLIFAHFEIASIVQGNLATKKTAYGSSLNERNGAPLSDIDDKFIKLRPDLHINVYSINPDSVKWRHDRSAIRWGSTSGSMRRVLYR